jgi:site-specific DNA-methyltransferase (adenine-specific)
MGQQSRRNEDTPMNDPYYSDDHVTIYHGDSFELLPTLGFDLMVTDPPYGIAYQPGGFPKSQTFDTLVGDDTSQCMSWALAQPGRSVIFGAEHAAQHVPASSTWHVWDKRESVAADAVFGSPFELLATSWQCERRMFRYLHGGNVSADRKIGGQKRRLHPTQKPVVLLRKILELWSDPDELIIDPFAGSGTTLRAAKDLNRHAVGIEIEERYCEIAARRMAQEVLPL